MTGSGSISTKCKRCGNPHPDHKDWCLLGDRDQPSDPIPSVPEMLEKAAGIYRERAGTYSDNYKHAGEVLMGLFPRGVMIQNADEFNRLHLIVHLASKLSRYCMNLKNGGHEDSLKDLSVYAIMALECDLEEARRKPPAVWTEGHGKGEQK